MNKNDKNLLYIITILLDISLLGIMYFTKTTNYENIWIIATLLCHIVFYFALNKKYVKLLDFLHIFVFVLPSLSIFMKNIYIKLLSLILLILIQILWIIKERCIMMMDDMNNFGYGKEINVYVICICIILSFQIGNSFPIKEEGVEIIKNNI
tara:strand:+ start:107 stop:562 length:456 start_codon:yes stop_codon:yes gene_type:complete